MYFLSKLSICLGVKRPLRTKRELPSREPVEIEQEGRKERKFNKQPQEQSREEAEKNEQTNLQFPTRPRKTPSSVHVDDALIDKFEQSLTTWSSWYQHEPIEVAA